MSVALVSTFHAISFFGLANNSWVSVMLAITFEIGQAAVLFSILTGASGKNKVIPWILMCVLTLVQVLGNVYSSYHYAVVNSPDEIKYFTDSVLFFIQDPDPQVNQVMISYITGAILPIVALCMTSMIVDVSGVDKNKVEEEIKEETNEESKIVY